MCDLSDETLMAYADGALGASEHARVQAMLVDRPELRERVAVFMATGKLLAEQFDRPMHEPVPRHLVDLVLDGKSAVRGASVGMATGDRPDRVWKRLSKRFQFELPRWPTALAYSAVLLIGVVSGWHLSRMGTLEALSVLEGGSLTAGGALARTLETTPSGARIALGGGVGGQPTMFVRIRFTFKSQQGFCRQYELESPTSGIAAGLACRGPNGRWQLRAHAITETKIASDGKTRPSSQGGSALLGAFVSQMLEGDALDATDEAGAIALSWRR